MAVISGAPRLAARSRIVGYDTRLRARMVVRDIHTYAEGIYNRENKSWPEGTIRGKVNDSTNSSSVITLKEKLALGGVYGETWARGTEEAPRTKDVVIYQANYRKVIPKPGYGLRKLETDKYKLYDEHEKDVTVWGAEEEGLSVRHAFLERYSPNTQVGDTAASCIPWWNPNIFIPTQGLYNQPAFNRTRSIHTTNICNGLMQTGGFGQFAARTMTAPVCEDLSNWLLAARQAPLTIPGLPTGKGFVVSVSEIMMGMMTNPMWVANNLGSQWSNHTRLTDEVINWPGVIGAYNNLLFVCDERQPTLLPSGSAAPYGLQAGYMWWDSRDLRNRANPLVKDTAFVFGEVAYIRMEGEPVHWISDTQDYDFRKGVGIAGVRADQLPIYLDPNSNAVTYQGGAVVVLDFPNGGTQA
jgi:hypothetical protein